MKRASHDGLPRASPHHPRHHHHTHRQWQWQAFRQWQREGVRRLWEQDPRALLAQLLPQVYLIRGSPRRDRQLLLHETQYGCKNGNIRLFRSSMACGQTIPASETVMRTSSDPGPQHHVYHKCLTCSKGAQLNELSIFRYFLFRPLCKNIFRIKYL